MWSSSFDVFISDVGCLSDLKITKKEVMFTYLLLNYFMSDFHIFIIP